MAHLLVSVDTNQAITRNYLDRVETIHSSPRRCVITWQGKESTCGKHRFPSCPLLFGVTGVETRKQPLPGPSPLTAAISQEHVELLACRQCEEGL
uniref:Uncharacterized protein n=1 Tax=Steinernema glaseri TaxID=37863 RepID=A0A1I7ZQW6_9BILA